MTSRRRELRSEDGQALVEFALILPIFLLMIAGIIPGPKKPKTLQPYLAVVVDELLDLYDRGVTYRHPATGEEWTAPEHLRRAKLWLQELVSSSGKNYGDFAAKK